MNNDRQMYLFNIFDVGSIAGLQMANRILHYAGFHRASFLLDGTIIN